MEGKWSDEILGSDTTFQGRKRRHNYPIVINKVVHLDREMIRFPHDTSSNLRKWMYYYLPAIIHMRDSLFAIFVGCRGRVEGVAVNPNSLIMKIEKVEIET